MKKTISISALIAVCTMCLSLGAYAQYPEDVLRLSTPGFGIGARSIGMGMAYTGVANDFSASYYNPAGLAQLRMNEVSLGLSNVSYGNSSSFFGSGESFTNSGTNINSLGLVYAGPTMKGSFVLALGYGRQSDFTTGLSFSGFNPTSSVIQAPIIFGGFGAPDRGVVAGDARDNPAYQLWLANVDTIANRWESPIRDSLTQSAKALEGGGLNHVSVSAAVEAARNLYLGATVNIITGSYSYQQNYSETDKRNLYATPPFDFYSLSLGQTVESDLSGFTANLGLLYKFGENSRVGISVKTPSWISIQETQSQTASSDFDNLDHLDYVIEAGMPVEYDVTTPFVFSAGLSYGIHNLMLTGDIDYTDWTQMEFRNADPDVMKLNTTIKDEFQPTLDVHVGAEIEPITGVLQLRGGFAYMRSPYQGDPSNYDKKYITAGAGYLVADAIAIDLAFVHGFWKNYRVNYNDPVTRVDEDIKTNNLIGTVSYRF